MTKNRWWWFEHTGFHHNGGIILRLGLTFRDGTCRMGHAGKVKSHAEKGYQIVFLRSRTSGGYWLVGYANVYAM